MTLTVAPAEGFDSFVSLEYAAGYMEKFGLEWPSEVPAQEVALRKATQYLQTMYQINASCIEPDVHANIKAACCEAAVRAVDGPLVSDTDGRIITEEKIDVITTKYAIGDGGNSGQTSYPLIDALMKSCVSGNANMIKLVRG